MEQITVTKAMVEDNMRDFSVSTIIEFDKPITCVILRMKNGFTLVESSPCVDPDKYSEEIGKQICLEKLEDKVWHLLGYLLQEKVSGKDSLKVESVVRPDENGNPVVYHVGDDFKIPEKDAVMIIDEITSDGRIFAHNK